MFPLVNSSRGLRGTLLLTAGVRVLGFALTLVLPEQAGRSLEDIPPGPPACRCASPTGHQHLENSAARLFVLQLAAYRKIDAMPPDAPACTTAGAHRRGHRLSTTPATTSQRGPPN